MSAWWNNLISYQQVLFIIAVSTTLIMIVQIIMMFAGIGDDSSFDSVDGSDFDGSAGDYGGGGIDSANDGGFGMIFGLRVLSVRSALAFFSIGAWVTFTFCSIMPWWGATLIGLAAGVAAAFLIAFVMKSLEKLQSSGNVLIANTVGSSAEVYLTIPAKREGTGKVNVFVQERYVEFNAVTDSKTPFKTGAKVQVVGTLDEGTVIVDKV